MSRFRPRKWWHWALYAFAAITILGALLGDTEDDPADPDEEAAQTTTREEPAAEEPPADTEPAEPPDTGRMTSDELANLDRDVAEFEREVGEFSDQFSRRCANLAGGGELAAVSDCVSDAYKGLDVRVAILHDTIEGLDDDTARTCRKRLRRMGGAVLAFAAGVDEVRNIAENLEFDQLDGANDALGKRSAAYRRARDGTRRACAPE